MANRFPASLPSLLSLALLSLACSPSAPEGSESEGGPEPVETPGWVTVDFGLDPEFVRANRGQMASVYDDQVGRLIDVGLDPGRSIWIKPTYGNRNIIWTLDGGTLARGHRRALTEAAGELGPTIQVEIGEFEAGGRSWSYAGYIDRTEGTGPEAFRSAVYACGTGATGVSVLYWGEGLPVEPHRVESVHTLLEKLAARCGEISTGTR